ncbi:MAG TPA: acetolactate synthase [Firmicutes bacterium]|nr:acetolactate synthase [Bacillota bacterium]
MQVQQLSVFVENKSGRLAEIAEIIAGAGADIRALTVADTSDFGILRLIVDKPQIAAQALRDADMTVSITSVIMMGLSDQPGAFAQAMRTLAENHVSVEYMYAFVSKDSGRASVIIRTDEVERGIEVLRAGGVTILSQEDIG